MTTAEPLVVVAGATGDLGARIVQALAANGTRTKVLVRRGAPRDTLPRSVEVVEVDYTQKRLLQAALRDATCVVSAVNGLNDVVLDVQSRLLDASVAAGVRRFIPSDFSLDFTHTRPGRNRNLDLRRTFKARVDAAPIAATSILNGAFADLLAGQARIVLPGIKRILYWGSADQRYDFTTKDDVASYTASVAIDAETPRILRIAGDTVSPRDLAGIMTKLMNTQYRLLRAGGLGALGLLIDVTRTLAPQPTAIFPSWQGMQYLRDMSSGEGELSPLDNDRYGNRPWSSASAVLAEAWHPSRFESDHDAIRIG